MWDIVFMFIKCFIVGGLICVIAQILINTTKITAGKILVLFMICGIVLQAFGLYEHLVNFAGAGATVPISGFGYLLAQGAIQGAKSGLLGVLMGGLKSAAAGVSAAVFFSFLCGFIFKPQSKRH